MRTRAASPQTRAILDAMLGEPLLWRHGYDLAKLAGLSSGTLYPLLIRLHERGLLEAKWTQPERPGRPPRHAYRLSADGLAYARQLAEAPAPASAPALRRPPEALA